MQKKREKIEFRYYTMPEDSYVLPMLGEGWVQEYGKGMGRMLHFHNYMEIGYCSYGGGLLLIEEEEHRYGGGNFTVIPEKIPHTTISDPGGLCKWEFLFIDVKGFLQNEFPNPKIPSEEMFRRVSQKAYFLEAAHAPEMAAIIRDILGECREQKKYWKESIKGLLYELMIGVLRLDLEQESPTMEQKINSYVKEAMRYVEEHYAEDMHIRDLAGSVGLSESRFRRIFEDGINMKPADYLNMVRIEKACEMIRQGSHSMEEISYLSGFSTPSTFHRNFKRFTDMTPGEWGRRKGGRSFVMRSFAVSVEPGWEAEDLKKAES
ncbi:MAG: AraC family transcriptional regulator [Lachnospiraceae bacterium]|nr:AraC family transcriptional regulator [Lachnospiraceae bacterium]